MKTPFRQLITGLCGMLGVSLVLGIGALWYLHTDHARTQILNALNRRIPGTVSIQDHKFSLISGRIELWNLRIVDFFQEEAAACDHLSATVSWRQLLQGTLHIQSASIEKPRIKISVDPDGVPFSHIFFEPDSDPKTADPQSGLFLPLILDAVTFKDATLSYEDSRENLSLCLDNMEADLSADFQKQAGKTFIRIGGGRISSPFFHSLFGPVSIQGSLEDGQILPLHLSLSSPGLNAEITGSISQIWQDPQFNLSLNMDSALSVLQQSLELETALSGMIHTTGTISGSLLNPNASLILTSAQATVSEFSLDRLRMTASLKDRIIALDCLSEPAADKGTIHITGGADLKQAFASGLFLPPVDLSALSGNMHVFLNSVSLDSFHPSATGVVNGTLALQSKGYPAHAPKADISIDLRAARISMHPDVAPVDIRIDSRSQWDDNGFRVQKLLAQAGTTRLTATGNWNSSDNHVSGDLSCQSDNLNKSLSPLGIRDIAGSLDIQTRLSGTLDQPEWSLKLKSSRLGFRDIQLGMLEVDAALGPSGMLRIFTLSLKNQGSELTAKGEVPFFWGKASGSRKPFALTAGFRRIQPVDFFRSSDIQGIIDGNCKLEGTEKSLSGSLDFQAKGLKVRAVRLGNVTGEFQLSEGMIQIQRLFLQNHRSHADFSGHVQIFEPDTQSIHRTMPFRLSGSGTALYAEDFIDFLKGKFSLAAELENNSGQFMGTASLQSEKPDTGQRICGQRLTSLELTADFKDNKLNISRAHAAVAPGEFLEASGWVSLDRTFQVKLSANGISLNHVDTLADNWPAGEGKLFLTLMGNGQLDHPRIQGEVVLNPFRFYESNWDHTRIELQIADDRARFILQSPIRGTASYQFQTRDYTADLDFIQAELSPFFQSAGLAGIGGSVSGKLSTSGNFNSLKTLKADASFAKLSLNAKGHPIIEGQGLNLGIQNEAVIIPRNRMILFDDGTLDIGGEARIGQSVSIHLNAEIPMNSARHFDDTLSDLRGNLVISAQMKGPWYNPDFEAFVDIRNAGLTFDKNSQDLHDVNGRIHITPGTIAVDHLEGQLDRGRISLKGKAAIDAFKIQALDFQMAASQFPIKTMDTLDAKLNADLTLQGTARSPVIQGEIVVLEGLYYKQVSINPIRSLIQRERSFQTHREIVFPSVIQNTLLDIRIPPRNLFVVDNNLAQLNLSPDMHITGTLQRPIIQGRTRVDSGSLQYQSTTFTIKKGFIDFINPYTLESVLDIQSQAAVQNWTVFLDISGPPDKLNLKLSSSPFLDDNDLLSLLITGKTSRATIHKSNDSNTSSQKMLADLLSASIGSDLKKASGLDILEVDSTGERRYVHDDPLKVTFGKIISPQITLKYSVETKGGVTFQRAITEYMFIENILLSGFQDSRGVFGGEVKFRHEFR
ncbi:MAG: translocation/assembly module TamB domain-containing protein [Pseudomonadota bacterium]